MFSSKAGVPKKRLRLHVADQPEPYQFSFTSPPAVADAELEKFKSLLAAVVSANTAGFVGLAPSTPRNAPTKLLGGSPTPPLGPSTSSQPSRPSPTPYGRSSSVVPLKGGQYSFDVYQKVLTKNPELADLHHVLVQSGQITEQEFWEGREVSILYMLILCVPIVHQFDLLLSTCLNQRLQHLRNIKGNLPKSSPPDLKQERMGRSS